MNNSRRLMSAWAKDSNSKSLTNAIRETNADIDVYSTMASTGPTATPKNPFNTGNSVSQKSGIFCRNLVIENKAITKCNALQDRLFCKREEHHEQWVYIGFTHQCVSLALHVTASHTTRAMAVWSFQSNWELDSSKPLLFHQKHTQMQHPVITNAQS
jgi:hypothetical protein